METNTTTPAPNVRSLRSKLKTEANAIENLVREILEPSEKSKLSNDQISLVFSLTTMDEIRFLELWNKKNVEIAPYAFKDSPTIRILDSRIQRQYNIKLSDRVLAFMLFVLESPGDAVIWAAYIAYQLKRNMRGSYSTKIEFNDFCIYIIPMGLLDKKEMSNFWDKQKVYTDEIVSGTDNLLDYFTASDSLRFVSEAPKS